MAAVFGLDGTSADRPIQYSGLNISSSKMDMPITIFWGMRRLPMNAIWYNNFQKHPVSKGGKGGGKGGVYDYTAAVINALCEGPIDLCQNIWSQASTTTTTTLAALNMTLHLGTASQAPESFVVTNYPNQARAYAYTAYVFCPKLDLGESATVPDIQFELKRLLSFSYSHTTPGYINPTTRVQSNGVDVLLSDVIPDLLINPQYGYSFASGDIGDLTQYAAYQRAQGFFFSPVIDMQDTPLSIIDRWAEVSNSWIYWSGTQFVFYPLADDTITGNGVTFTPENDVAYDLGPEDFIGDVPVKVNRIDPSQAKNHTVLDITDRTIGYSSNPLEYKDQTLLDQYGIKDNSTVDGKDICDPIVGKIVVQLLGKRAAYLRNTYSFKTNYRFIRCLPGTVLTLTDPNIPLDHVRVRVRTVAEGKDDSLEFVCEEFPGTIATYSPYDPSQGNVPTFPDQNIDPGPANVPAVIEPDSSFTGGVSRLLISASGGPNWGEAEVWLAFNGSSDFIKVGDITAAAGQGVLTANLANHADPDTVNTLSVDLTESQTILPAVTNADADALRTLVMIYSPPVFGSGVYTLPTDGEIAAWGNTSTTGTYTADLTYLRRGQYGTAPASHSTGDLFSTIDVLGNTGTTLAYDLPPQYIGAPISIKLVSKNLFGLAPEDISTVAEYVYTPTGRGYGGGTNGAPLEPTGLATSPGTGQITVSWNPNAVTDNVTAYKLYAATGPGGSFGSAALIYQGNSTTFVHTGITVASTFTYFLIAENRIGDSPHTVGVDGTCSSPLPSGGGGATGFGFFVAQRMADNELLGSALFPTDMIFVNADPENFIVAQLAATGTAVMNIVTLDPTTGAETLVGTITFTAGSHTGTVAWLSSPYTLPAGTVINLHGPSPADLTLAFIRAHVNGTPP